MTSWTWIRYRIGEGVLRVSSVAEQIMGGGALFALGHNGHNISLKIPSNFTPTLLFWWENSALKMVQNKRLLTPVEGLFYPSLCAYNTSVVLFDQLEPVLIKGMGL
jgi:hypothetical protein